MHEQYQEDIMTEARDMVEALLDVDEDLDAEGVDSPPPRSASTSPTGEKTDTLTDNEQDHGFGIVDSIRVDL